MNERPYPQFTELSPINVNAKSDTEIQRVYATLNQLVAQFNDVIRQGGNLQQQINAIINRLGDYLPFDGVHNDRFISNAVLQEWPVDQFIVGKTISATHYDLFTIDAFNVETRISAQVGPLFVEGGAVYLDGYADNGIARAGDDVEIYVAGNALLTFAYGSPYKAVFQPLAGVLIVAAGGAYLDTSQNVGIYKSGNNLVLKSASGIITTAANFNTDGDLYADGYIRAGTNYYSADNTVGASATTGGATFKNGLYTGGTITGSGDPGTVEDVTVADPPNYYARYNDTGPDNENGAWQDLSTFFPDLPSPADTWVGNAYITTLGTITTGTWNATPIATAYIADDAVTTAKINAGAVTVTELATDAVETAKIKDLNVTTGKLADGAVTAAKMADLAAYTILGNDTALADTPIALTVAEVLVLLDIEGEIDSFLMDSPGAWAGSSYITNLGAVTTCPSLTSQGPLQGTYVKTGVIRPLTDGVTTGLRIANADDSSTVVWVDSDGLNITVENQINANTVFADTSISTDGYFYGDGIRPTISDPGSPTVTFGIDNRDGGRRIVYITCCSDDTVANNYATIPNLVVPTRLIIPIVS